jgi:hypothetical protein
MVWGEKKKRKFAWPLYLAHLLYFDFCVRFLLADHASARDATLAACSHPAENRWNPAVFLRGTQDAFH